MRFKHFLPAMLLLVPSFMLAEAPANRMNSAAAVISELMSTPDKGIPQELVDRAQCVIVVPGLKGGAFVFGGKYGKGFFSCRRAEGWSAPGSVRLEAGSVGFQIGGINTDLVLLVMNSRGADHLLTDQFTLGSQGEVAAGPLGRTTTAQTDAMMQAEMLSWSRSRGVFAGISLQGATIRQDRDDNAALYGSAYRNKDVVLGNVAWPKVGSELEAVLNRYAPARRQFRRR